MTNKDQYKIGIISEHAQGMVTSKLESLASVHKQQFSVFFAMQLMATLKKNFKKNSICTVHVVTRFVVTWYVLTQTPTVCTRLVSCIISF